MQGFIQINGVIGELPNGNGGVLTPNYTLVNLIAELENIKDATEIVVGINSPGGSVEEGFRIHQHLRSLAKSGKQITTRVDNLCASIATVILLAGDKRIAGIGSEIFIHNAWLQGINGNASELEAAAKDMRALDGELAKFYAGNTHLTKEMALLLMERETSLSHDEALKLGFVTEVEVAIIDAPEFNFKELKAVAFHKKLTHKTEIEMSENKILNQLKQTSDRILALLKGQKVALMLQDANGTEIDFPKLSDGQLPAVGDEAVVDGKPAEGSYTMPQLNAVVVFVGGKVTEIKPAEEAEALRKEVARLKEELAKKDSQIAEAEVAVLALKKDFDAIKEITSPIIAMQRREAPPAGSGKKAVQGMKDTYKRKTIE